MGSQALTNFEIQIYYQKKLKINGLYSKNNSSEKKDEEYIINLD